MKRIHKTPTRFHYELEGEKAFISFVVFLREDASYECGQFDHEAIDKEAWNYTPVKSYKEGEFGEAIEWADKEISRY